MNEKTLLCLWVQAVCWADDAHSSDFSQVLCGRGTATPLGTRSWVICHPEVVPRVSGCGSCARLRGVHKANEKKEFLCDAVTVRRQSRE